MSDGIYHHDVAAPPVNTGAWAVAAVSSLLPAAIVLWICLSYWLAPSLYSEVMNPEEGVLEIGVTLVLAVTFAIGVTVLTSLERKTSGGLWYWVAGYCFGVFFFLGEDANWGQYYFDLIVPDYFILNNKEQEINLHNMSSWFNQKPRHVVELWVLVAGVACPLGWNWPKRVTRRFVPQVLWPGRETLVVALLAMLVILPGRVFDLVQPVLGLDSIRGVRVSELQEFCFAWFMMLYIWHLGQRIRRTGRTRPLASAR